VLSERIGFPVTNDEMIEHAYIDERQGLLEPLRDVLVGLAGFGDARRMVVGENRYSNPTTFGKVHIS
jgi:hypothetical protein